MNEDKQYIKPYKLKFLQAYIDYMYLTKEKNEKYISTIEFGLDN